MSIWIESHVELAEHPKVFVLTETLGVRRAETVGLLHMLWHFTMKFAWRDGDLTKFDDIAIARGSGWELEPQKFILALQESKFMDGKKIHDWQSFAGKLIRDRLYKEATRVRQESPVGDKSTPKAVTNPTKPLPNQKNTPIVPNGDGRFETFWKAYPKKIGKGAAEKAWKKISSVEAIFEKALRAVAIQSRSDQWLKEGGQFVPHPATWLNQRRWEDEVGVREKVIG